MKKADRRLLAISIIGYVFLSVSVLLMPAGNGALRETPWRYLPGGLFWLSLLVGIIPQFVLSARYRSWRKKQAGGKKRPEKSQRIGLISFFRNPLARVADILLILSIVALATVMLLISNTSYVCYILLALTIFSFCMHCILNGRVFCCIIMRNALDK